MGRPRLVGQRLPQLDQVLVDSLTAWHKAWVKWYGQGKQQIEWCSGTALWYRGGQAPLPIRWVLTRDLKGERDARAYFSTAQDQSGLSIIIDFMKRWCVEVTFEESRAHLGIETQRQWSDMAIERTTPCLFGLYSVVALLGRSLHPTGIFHSNKLLGIKSRKPPLRMCSLLCDGICGTISVIRHHPKTLMLFYSRAQIWLALLTRYVPRLKMCKVQVSERR